MALATVLGGFNAIFGPMAADLHARGETERLRALYRRATRWGLLAVLPVLVPVLAAPRELLTLVFTSAYADGAPGLFWLGVGQAVNVATGGVGFLLMMTGRERVWLGWTATALALNVPLNLWLIPRWGIAGAAIATTLSIAVLYSGAVLSMRRLLRVWPWGPEYRRLGVCGLLVPACLWAARALDLRGTWWLAAAVLAGLAPVLAALAWAGWRERRAPSAGVGSP
jgi:O-antigen/teichoic acid export membrane protein